MSLLQNGSTRLVFLTEKYAIKFPRCCVDSDDRFYGRVIGVLKGWMSNRIEYKWASNTTYYDYLCPLKYSFLFSFIIVMKRAVPLTREEFFSINVSDYRFPHEHKQDSYGKVDGKIVIVDFG